MSRLKTIGMIYVIALHILCVIMLLKSDFVERVANVAGFVSQPATFSAHYDRMISYHERMDASVPIGATIFIGDSFIQGLAVSAVSDLSVNYGIGSDTTEGVLHRLPLYKSINNARSIVLAIGVNDLLEYQNAAVIQNYEKILELLPENRMTVVSAVLPVDERVKSIHPLSNKRINDLNSAIKTLTDLHQKIIFVDAGDSLKNIDGNLKTEFHAGDGIHLSADGYRVWIELLREALEGN